MRHYTCVRTPLLINSSLYPNLNGKSLKYISDLRIISHAIKLGRLKCRLMNFGLSQLFLPLTNYYHPNGGRGDLILRYFAASRSNIFYFFVVSDICVDNRVDFGGYTAVQYCQCLFAAILFDNACIKRI